MSLQNAEASEQNQDVDAVKTVIESVGNLADSRNFESLEKFYAKEIEVDYTSLSGGKPQHLKPEQLMTEWASFLPGFDLTRHNISNIKVTLKGHEAEATADIMANHYLNGQHWQASGDYLYRLNKTGDNWKITYHQFNFKSDDGDKSILGLAQQRATQNPVSYLQRQKTIDLARSFLKALETKDMELLASVWAEDAQYLMPYSPEGFPKKLDGREAIIKNFAAWPQNSGKADFLSEFKVYPMIDPTMIFAEFTGDIDVIPTGRHYVQHYGGLFHAVNGKVQLFREYYDPAPFKFAFGLGE